MVTYKGQHCVIVSIINAYKAEIHTRDGAKRVEFIALRETERGEIQKQMKLAHDGKADNSELWQTT